MNHSALEYRNVTVRYEASDTPVIDAVSFLVEPGQKVALTGLNGSGKTTLLRAAVGLVPHKGEIIVDGDALTTSTLPKVRDRVGFLFNVPEDQLLFPNVLEDVAFGLLRRGFSRQEATAKALSVLTSLGASHLSRLPVHHLSHGQKQRVALAGAMVTEPSLLLLDEPSAGLDPPGKRALAGILRNLNAATMVATHDLDFAEQLCSRFLTIDQGRISLDERDSSALRRRWA